MTDVYKERDAALKLLAASRAEVATLKYENNALRQELMEMIAAVNSYRQGVDFRAVRKHWQASMEEQG